MGMKESVEANTGKNNNQLENDHNNFEPNEDLKEEASTKKNNQDADENLDEKIEEGGVEELTVIRQKLQEKEDQIIDMEKKVSEYEDLLRRRQAEFENYKKRTIKERDDFQKTANQRIIQELLPIVDNFEKAIDSSKEQGKKETLFDGIVLIEKQLKKLLENYNVKEIMSVGREFDPNYHEALQIDESAKGYKVDTVISEWQKGYLLGNKVIRHSRVVVAKAVHEDDDHNNNKQKIPKNFGMSQFEDEVLKKIVDDAERDFVEKSYQKEEGEYIIKAEIASNEKEKEKLLEILKKIGYIKNK